MSNRLRDQLRRNMVGNLEGDNAPLQVGLPDQSTTLVNQSGLLNQSTKPVDQTSLPNKITKQVDQTSRLNKSTKPVDQNSKPELFTNEVTQTGMRFVRKQTLADTHKHKTFLIRKDILAAFEALTKKQERGFETWYINNILENALIQKKEYDDKK